MLGILKERSGVSEEGGGTIQGLAGFVVSSTERRGKGSPCEEPQVIKRKSSL